MKSAGRMQFAVLAAVAIAVAGNGHAATAEFGTWEQAVASGDTLRKGGPVSPGGAAPKETAPKGTSASAAKSAGATVHDEGWIVRFGAGASYMVSFRPSDLASGKRVMSEFSLNVAPFGRWLEVGADLSLARDGQFFAVPNVKLLVGNLDHALYLQGAAAIYSGSDSAHLGWGGGLGALAGILPNLAIELFANALVFDLSPGAADPLVGQGVARGDSQAASKTLVLYAGARLCARF
ncbi:MAG: hypothetical protein D6806_15850 [Deltaproteobacteria bacterium]|nr:MAG: hypothetical protein D6806_15850 [Deltaproteobacteria bacterium]